MRNRAGILLTLAGALLLIPSTAHANGITPMLAARVGQLLYGNIIIGIGESWLLFKLFKLNPDRVRRTGSAVGMIAANYVSLIAGFVLFGTSPGQSVIRSLMHPIPLYNAPKVLCMLAAFSLLFTILLEWPFCVAVLREGGFKGNRVWASGFLGSIAVQVISYAVISPVFFWTSSLSIYRDFDVSRDLSFARNRTAMVYFIDEHGGIFGIHPDGTGLREIMRVSEPKPGAWLFIYPSKDGKHGDLYLCQGADTNKQKLIVPKFTSSPPPEQRQASCGRRIIDHEWINYGYSLDLRTQAEQTWRVFSEGPKPGGGLLASMDSGFEQRIGFETPFLEWDGYCANVLPGQQVVAQMSDQILLIDLEERKVGLLAMGRGPVVSMAETDEATRASSN